VAQSSAQLVTDACQICKCPQFSAQAGRYLNTLLGDLAACYDFPSARQTNVLNIGPNAGTGYNVSFYQLNLPNGVTYLRTKEVFYNVSGTIFYLNQIPLSDYDKLFQGTGISNYPYWFTVNTEFSPPQMAFYPPPNLTLAVTIRTQFQPNDITTPETSASVPWFPDQRYLKTQLCADLMQLTGDQRKGKFDGDAMAMLTAYTKMVDDKEGYAMQVQLDRRMFRSTSDLKPTKTTGF
jgi:hypothetical protein